MIIPKSPKGSRQKAAREAEGLPRAGPARRCADDRLFMEAAQSPSAAVRIEALRAWAAGKKSPRRKSCRYAERRRPARPRGRFWPCPPRKVLPDAIDYLPRASRRESLRPSAAVRGLGQLDDEWRGPIGRIAQGPGRVDPLDPLRQSPRMDRSRPFSRRRDPSGACG